MEKDSTKSILRGASRFLSGTLLSRVSGMFRDIAMAFAFGTQASVAAFFFAFRLAHLLRRLLGEGAMQNALIPKFEELRHKDPKRACLFFCDLYGLLILILLGIIGIAAVALGGAAQYFQISEGNQEVLTFFVLMLPSLPFICLYGLNASILQCEKQFFLPGVAPVAFNLIWIGGASALWYYQPPNPMIWLSGVVVVACGCQWLCTLPKTIQILQRNGILRPWRQFNIRSRDLLLLSKPLCLGFVGVAATQINSALDPFFARYAAAEGPALLWYALRIQQLPLALFGIALSGALLPPLTRALRAGDATRYRTYFRFAWRQCLWIMVPMTLGLLFFGQTAIQWIYRHGNFTEQSATQTSACLWYYSWGLLPMALILVVAPVYYSRGNFALPATASGLAVALNIFLNTWMVMGLGLGPSSVALATSISAWGNLLVLLVWLKRTLPCPVPALQPAVEQRVRR